MAKEGRRLLGPEQCIREIPLRDALTWTCAGIMTAHSVQGMRNSSVKRAFKYRFYPTDMQAAELSRTFGCVRKVYNLALTARTDTWTVNGERVSYPQTSAMLTAWKKTEELAYLAEVSSVPLQQALRHLQAAFTGFWGKRAQYPASSRSGSPAPAPSTRAALFAIPNGDSPLRSWPSHWTSCGPAPSRMGRSHRRSLCPVTALADGSYPCCARTPPCPCPPRRTPWASTSG